MSFKRKINLIKKIFLFTPLVVFMNSVALAEYIPYKKTISMWFVYGEGPALPKRPEVKAKSTFEAILLGERAATSRHDSSLDDVQIGETVRFVRDRKNPTDGEIFAKVLAKRAVKKVSPEEWSLLEGYKLEEVIKNWDTGHELSSLQAQIVYQIIGYRPNPKAAIQKDGFPEHPLIKKYQ